MPHQVAGGCEMVFVLRKYSIADHLSIFVGGKNKISPERSFMSVLKGLKGLFLQLIFSLLSAAFN